MLPKMFYALIKQDKSVKMSFEIRLFVFAFFSPFLAYLLKKSEIETIQQAKTRLGRYKGNGMLNGKAQQKSRQ